jgi:hypothetical protein
MGDALRARRFTVFSLKNSRSFLASPGLSGTTMEKNSTSLTDEIISILLLRLESEPGPYAHAPPDPRQTREEKGTACVRDHAW